MQLDYKTKRLFKIPQSVTQFALQEIFSDFWSPIDALAAKYFITSTIGSTKKTAPSCSKSILRKFGSCFESCSGVKILRKAHRHIEAFARRRKAHSHDRKAHKHKWAFIISQTSVSSRIFKASCVQLSLVTKVLLLSRLPIHESNQVLMSRYIAPMFSLSQFPFRWQRSESCLLLTDLKSNFN